MHTETLEQLFITELTDMYSAEKQIVAALPSMISSASCPELKKALTHHLEETKQQVKRIEKVCNMLGVSPNEGPCEAMKGILKEANSLVSNEAHSSTLDAAIICACQKVEHYEMATYGTLVSFASFLELDSKIGSLLQESLDEEGAANKKLTKIAEGTIFSRGIIDILLFLKEEDSQSHNLGFLFQHPLPA